VRAPLVRRLAARCATELTDLVTDVGPERIRQCEAARNVLRSSSTARATAAASTARGGAPIESTPHATGSEARHESQESAARARPAAVLSRAAWAVDSGAPERRPPIAGISSVCPWVSQGMTSAGSAGTEPRRRACHRRSPASLR
jgi:hypothetical protein